MASAPSEPRVVLGRVDRSGRLISADPELAALQLEAGSAVGSTLALPQVAAIARLARKLGIPVSRPAMVAGLDRDIDLWVRAVPEDDDVALSLEGWSARPAASPRLAALLGGASTAEPDAAPEEWVADAELKLVSVSPALAERLGIPAAKAPGQPLTKVFRLEEDEQGAMPLLNALAARHGFADQPARARTGDTETLLTLSGDVVFAPDGSFAGFTGRAVGAESAGATHSAAPTTTIDQALDEALRTPIDRIIDCAERIAARGDGPLRGDYATYATDIAAAARHLLSVIGSMSQEQGHAYRTVDLAALAAEAVVLVDAAAELRRVSVRLDSSGPLPANGEERAVIQILVNLIGNAVRHSPEGGSVILAFHRDDRTVAVTVADEGPGIAEADQQRIFERFERADPAVGGTGLGLAISRRLARSMGGDITLDSTPGEGARFTLALPLA